MASTTSQARCDIVLGGAETILELSGDWHAHFGTLPDFTAALLSAVGASRKLVVTDAGVGQWDSGLIAFLWDVKRVTTEISLDVDWARLPPSMQKLVALLPNRVEDPVVTPGASFAPLKWVGGRAVGLLSEIGAAVLVLSAGMQGGVAALMGRGKVRRIDIAANIRDAGPSALAIVGIVNFLVGAILAFVGAAQLKKFAADIYVANLVGLAVVREMACIITAIVMAGRTGGAYAARIATMQGNEEIDALQVFGIPVSEYVVLPAILALAVTMPILYLYGCAVGMTGGLVVSKIMLNITSISYFHQTFGAVSFGQFIFGAVKSVSFAVMIGVTSCRIGLRAGRSAADVGRAATEAVVIGIVGVIAMDAVFAVMADAVGFR